MTANDTDISKKNKKDAILVNYNIHCGKVRLIDNGDVSVMRREDAQKTADERGLDLVQISFDAANHLAVCKILDYGKFKYEQSKKEKTAKKLARANAIEIKTVQFSITTDDADKNRLIEQAKEFLSKGDKVKLSIRFRSRREGQMVSFAKEVMKEILSNFNDVACLDSLPGVSGRELSCIIRPVKDNRR